jgi:hypothetical protein
VYLNIVCFKMRDTSIQYVTTTTIHTCTIHCLCRYTIAKSHTANTDEHMFSLFRHDLLRTLTFTDAIMSDLSVVGIRSKTSALQNLLH